MSRVDEWREEVKKAGDKRVSQQRASTAGPLHPRREASRKSLNGRSIPPERPQSAAVPAVARDKLRPLGCVAKMADNTVSENKWTQNSTKGSGRGFVTKLKAEILAVQRKIDSILFSDNNITEVSPAMSRLEQKLFHYQFDSDPERFLQTQVDLLEILIANVTKLSQLTSDKVKGDSSENAQNDLRTSWAKSTFVEASPPSRIGVFLALADITFNGVNTAIETAPLAPEPPPPTPPSPPETLMATSGTQTEKKAKSSEIPEKRLKDEAEVTKELEELKREQGELKARLAAAQHSLQVNNRYESFVLHRVDAEYLEKVGMPAPEAQNKLSVARQKKLEEDIQAAVFAAYEASDEPIEVDPKAKGGKPGKGKPEDEEDRPSVVARLQVSLTTQARYLAGLVELLKKREEEHNEFKNSTLRDIGILKCTAKTASDQLAHTKETIMKERTHHANLLEVKELDIVKLKECLKKHEKVGTKQKKRVQVATDRDPPDEEAIMQEMQKRIKKLEVESVRAGQDYAELEKAREVTQIKCDEVQRENGSLRQLLQASHSEGRSVAEHNHALEGRLFKATEASQRSVKEAEKIRACKEADVDTIRRQSIELSICRNSIAGLRKREELLSQNANESEWKWQRVREENTTMQRKSLETTSALQFELSHLQEEVLAHKASEVALREQLSQYEMSARKLKVTEAELLSLQRDFKNYTLCKIRQGETSEEDERKLQECLQIFTEELFRLPDSSAPEDVELMIQQLEEKKRRLESADARSEKSPQKQNAMGLLVCLLKRRMNAIQLFAFTEKKKVFVIEEQLREVSQSLGLCKEAQHSDMVQAKRYGVQLAAEEDANRRFQTHRADLEQQLADLTVALQNNHEVEEQLKGHIASQQSELATIGCTLQDYQAHYPPPFANLEGGNSTYPQPEQPQETS